MKLEIKGEKMTLTFQITAKNRLRKYFWTPTGFKLGTLRLWVLHATKTLTGTVLNDLMILLSLNKCNLFNIIFHKIFPNKKATKNLAQITKWQLEYLQKWLKVALKKFFLPMNYLKIPLEKIPELTSANLLRS